MGFEIGVKIIKRFFYLSVLRTANMQKQSCSYLFFSLMAFAFMYCIIPSCRNIDATSRNTDTVKILSGIKYGSNTDWQGNFKNLLLDVYTPPGILNNEKLPLVVYVHGGGFQDGTKEDAKALMTDFVSSGFIAVSINYRLGWTQADSCIGDTTGAKEAVYRAVQDTKAAIRYLVANAEKYNIDTSYIFLSGESAGAITILSTNYFTQSYANSFVPGAEQKLGYLDDADNTLKNQFTIKGIGSVAGCLNNADLINKFNIKPTIYMHGLLDNVIPYNTGTAFNCPNYLSCFGSNYLYNVSKTLAPTILHLDSTGAHNVYDESFIKVNQVCFFKSIIQKELKGGFFTGETPSCP